MNRKEEIEKLEKRLAELKSQPDFEVGKWYLLKDGNIWFNTKVNHTGWGVFMYGYGWHPDDTNYSYNPSIENICVSKIERPATKEEVEAALIKEAERRGFKEGVYINNCNIYHGPNCSGWNINGSEYDFDFEENRLDLTATIFHNGQWVEIIEEPKVVINGKEVRRCQLGYQIGCTTVVKSDLGLMIKLAKEYNLKSITHNEIGEIKIEQLNKILSLKK